MQATRRCPGDGAISDVVDTPPAGPRKIQSRRERFVERDSAWSKQLAYCGLPLELSKPLKILRWICRLLEYSGHGVPWFVLALSRVSISIHLGSIQFWTNVTYALIIDLVVVGIVKTIFRRTRPDYALQHNHVHISPDRFSFPSGHSSRSVMLATIFCSHWITSPLSKNLFAIWAGLVCVSRAVLGRHYISDVLAGAVLGAVDAYITRTFLWLELKTCLMILWPLHEYIFI